MDREEIIQRFLDLIKFHFEGGASVYQEPYKGDFFRLFKEAYRKGYIADGSPLLNADAFSELIASRWHTGDDEKDKQKIEMAWKVLSMWGPWTYAWDHYEP